MIKSAQSGVAALVFVFVAVMALAQTAAVTIDIGFAFVAGGKSMPAGKYQIDVQGGKGPVILRGDAKGADAIMPVMTRLGRHDSDTEVELVFDKVGTTPHLSEVWLPGEDGYLLLGTKERHDHVVLGGPKGKR